MPDFNKDAGAESIHSLDKLRYANGSRSTANIRMEMQGVMQDNAAVYRTQETLAQGKKLIDETVKAFNDVKVCCLVVIHRSMFYVYVLMDVFLCIYR